ncbi:MAG: hypothetical protein BWX92_03504 [Deltaproteobacteria bacterium ADurb.Bin135]|nr:MAG: hypothetical protein BWX92_03504 [Deltaproteobacteria bacterium ADurb.Bin135]
MVYPSVDCFPTVKTDHKNGKDTRTMRKDNVIEVNKPETSIEDSLTEILRHGARSFLAQSLEVEMGTVLNQYKELKGAQGDVVNVLNLLLILIKD